MNLMLVSFQFLNVSHKFNQLFIFTFSGSSDPEHKSSEEWNGDAMAIWLFMWEGREVLGSFIRFLVRGFSNEYLHAYRVT